MPSTRTSPAQVTAGRGTAGRGTAARLGVRGWLTLVTLCGATFMTGLDFAVVTVALPQIGRDLGFASPGSLQWVATACLLPTASLLPLFSRVSDLVGRRGLFVVGVVVFVGFSLFAGLATSPATLIAARVGQGTAAAMIAPTAIALLTTAFPEGPLRTKALGVNGAVLSLGFVLGTLGGGVITSGLSWRWTMLVLVGIGAVVLLGAPVLLPRTADARVVARLDVPGAVLASVALFALVNGVSIGAEAGWGSATTLGSLVLAVTAIGIFLLVERRAAAPLIPLRLLARPAVRWSGLVGLITFGMCGGTTVLLSLYMQDVLGYSALATGAGFLAEGIAALVGGILAARLVAVLGNVGTMAVGLTVQGLGTGAMILLPEGGDLVLLSLTSGAMGLGHVLTVISFISTMTAGLRDDEQGVVAGLSQLPQFLGGVGTASLAAIVTARAAALSTTTSPTVATLGGLHAAMLTAGIVCLVGVVLTLTFLRRPMTEPR